MNKSTSRSKALMPIIREIFWLSVEYNITVSASYIAGKLNVLPDRISRLDQLLCAYDARFLLAGFGREVVYCSTNMSFSSFIWLQERWTVSLRNCVRKQLDINI